MIKKLAAPAVVALALASLTSGAQAFCLDRTPSCLVRVPGGRCVLPGPNPDQIWQVAPGICYPDVNDYHYPAFRVKCNNRRCWTSEEYYSSAALEPDCNLEHWYGNTYDGAF